MLGEAILRQEMQDSGAQWQVNEQPLTNAMSFSAIAFLFYGPFFIENGFVLLIPYFGIHMVEEKEKRQKHQLLVSGLPLGAYWGGNLMADYTLYFISATLNVSILYMARLSMFTENNVAGPICVFVLYGFLAIMTGYIISFMFQKVETANKWLYSVATLLVMIPYVVIQVGYQGRVPDWVNYAMCIFPPYCLYYSMFRLSLAVFTHQGLTFMETFSFTQYGLGGILTIMLAECVILLLLLVWMDYGLDVFKNRVGKKVSALRFEFDQSIVKNDDDVLHEKERLDREEDREAKGNAIFLQHIWKAYKASSEITCTS